MRTQGNFCKPHHHRFMQTIVITSCSSRKRSGLGEPLRSTDLKKDTLDAVAQRWLTLSSVHPWRTTAGDLYVGRSISEARKAASHINADLFFASTGFGLVSDTSALPPYDLTVASGNSSLQDVVIESPFNACDWWHAINAELGSPYPISSLLSKKTTSIAFVALSRPYLKLIHDDLAKIAPKDTCRLRIFTSPSSAGVVPTHLHNSIMPYDKRFDGIDSPNPGTQTDFPQRAMRHFVCDIFLPEHPDLERECLEVNKTLSQLTFRQLPKRSRKTDIELITIMNEYWDRTNGRAHLMLRLLRDDLAIACEQKRFALLFRTLRQRRQNSQGIFDGSHE